MVVGMKGSPSQPDPRKPGGLYVPVSIEGRIEKELEEAKVPEKEEVRTRRLKIRRTLLEDIGYTEGCEGCRYARAGMEANRNHSE